MTPTLRDYQQNCITGIRNEWIKGYRSVLLQSPTGSGKTVMFAWMTSEAFKRGKRVIIGVHRRELLDQVIRALRSFGIEPGLIAGNESMDQTRSVQVASIPTLTKRLDRVLQPDLMIFDEAAHSAAAGWARVLNHWPAPTRILGVTATPERLDGKGLGIHFKTMVNGPTVADLITRGFLSRPVYYVPPSNVDLSAVRTTAGDYNKSDLETAIDTPSITGDIVAHYQRFCLTPDGKPIPTVAFCVSIKHAEQLAQSFRNIGVRSATIDGNLSPTDRRDRVESLADGRIHVLTSCEIISEGFDLPVIGAAILARPTQSLSLHLQQIGRALRIYPGKTRAVILDHAGNCLRHGLAEEPREWSLEGYAERKKNKREGEAKVRVRQCPQCFCCHEPSFKCPECGYEYGGRVVKTVPGTLVELTMDDQYRQCVKCQKVHSISLTSCPECGWDYKVAERIERGRMNTIGDLVAFGKKKGYRNPYAWASHVLHARQAKRSGA